MATKYRDRPRTRGSAQPARPEVNAPDISLQPAQPVYGSGPLDEVIRTRAYYLWEQAGRPDGDGREFWLKAEREIGNRD